MKSKIINASRVHFILMTATLVALLIATTLPVNADEQERLSAAEIETLLSGNTAIGKWDGTPYRQYFSDDGSTIYAQEGSRSSSGQWRVNRTKNLYESWWQRSDWSGYPVVKEGGTYYWISPSLPPQAFEVVPGEQLVVAD